MARIERTFVLGGLLAVSLGVSAQTSTAEQLTVHSQFQSGAAVRDDSRRFFPQVNARVRSTVERPENPPPPVNNEPGPVASNILLGGTTNLNRLRFKALFPGIGATGWTPPDPNIAVGPSHVVEVVNSDIAWFDKGTGAVQFQQGMDGAGGWFGAVGATDFVFDPKCFYDAVSQRYFVLALELQGSDTSKLLIAVSDDNNPSGTWFKYRIEAKLTVGTNTWWMDYPSFASNKDGLAVCGNMFPLAGNGGWGGVQFVCMKKSPMLTGASTTVTSLRDPNAGSAQLSRTNDGATGVLYGMQFASTSQLRLYGIQNFLTTPTVQFADIPIPAFVPPNRAARSTNGRELDSIDSRPFNSVYRAGKVYATHNTMVSNSDDRLTAKWYQVQTNNWPLSGNPTLEMAGSVAGTNVDHFMPAIGVNNVGDVSLVFSRSCSSIIADVMVTSRRSADAPGTMGAPQKLQGSVSDYGSPGDNRWGDYFDMAIDPSDGLKFWSVGMISNNGGNWQTVIHSFNVSTPISQADAYDAVLATMYDGSSATGGTSDLWAVDGSVFSVASRFVRSLGAVAAIETRYQVGTTGGAPSAIGIKVKANSTLKNTGMWWLYNFTTNKFDHIGSWSQPTSMATPLVLSTTKNLTKYISTDGEVRVVVRTTTKPTQNVSYVLNADLIQLLLSRTQGS